VEDDAPGNVHNRAKREFAHLIRKTEENWTILKTENAKGERMKYGRSIIGFLLAAGGLLGILGSVQMGFHSAQQHDILRVISAIIGIVLFAWSILAGVELWRARPRGFKWAKILFALQIPTFSVAHVVFEFSTLLSFRVMIGSTTHHIGGNIGSSCNIYLLPQSLGFMLGINLVAAVVLWYLVRRS
jgi:hypothetical protein